MQFNHQGTLITLHSSSNSLPTPAKFHQIQRMMHTKAIATCSITMITPDPTMPPFDSLTIDNPLLNTTQPDLVEILQHYAQVFSIPLAQLHTNQP